MQLGVSISDSEISLNVLGDFGVVGEGDEDMLPSAFDENMLFSPLKKNQKKSSTSLVISDLNATGRIKSVEFNLGTNLGVFFDSREHSDGIGN